MDINFSKEDLQFRDELREWLANDYPKHVKDNYKNYLENQLRDRFEFSGVPISIIFKEK